MWGEERPRACGDPGGGWGTPGAHPKHLAHVCGFGRVKTQRLVEHQRTLPSGREDIQSGQHAGWELGGYEAAAVHAACRRRPE